MSSPHVLTGCGLICSSLLSVKNKLTNGVNENKNNLQYLTLLCCTDK